MSLKQFQLFQILLILNVVISDVICEINQFNYCLRDPKKPTLKECVGRTAISYLQSFVEKDNFTIVPGVVASKDDSLMSSRSMVNFLDQDPVNFRGIFENAGAVFGQRSLQWHMDNIYPGLMLKVGPTSDANSVLEFDIDHHLEHDERAYLTEDPSTARILTKQYLLPLLLGLKFNLATLVPLVFAGVLLLLKKAAFLAKFAIFLSTVFGVGGALSLSGALDYGLGGGGGGFGHRPIGPLGGVGVLGGGYIPGKAGQSAYTDPVELHDYGYLRTGRKFKFDKPREHLNEHETETTTSSTSDRFYDYERNVLLQGRNAGLFESSHKAIINNEHDDNGNTEVNKNYSKFGWKVIH